VKVVFDENTPRVVAHAIKLIVEADALGSQESLEVHHALDIVQNGTKDVLLIQAVVEGGHSRAALVTTDKSMRTRSHERAAFAETGCIGIVLTGEWNHASMMERAHHSLLWWSTWMGSVRGAPLGALLKCPWSGKPKPLKRI
jgi:hypothetical protein